MKRILLIATAVLLTAGVLPGTARAQSGGTVRVIRNTPVTETPRGDSVVLGTLPAGTVVDVLAAAPGWYRVAAPQGATEYKWQRGWVREDFVQVVTPGAATVAQQPTSRGAAPSTQSARPAPSGPRDPLLIRGFGQGGGTIFTARDSFETILDTAFGGVYGGGGQVAFGNGYFGQVGVDRFRKTGSRVLMSGERIFRLSTPHVIEVTPIQVTVGWRDPTPRRTVGYAGAGIGSYALKESSPDLANADSKQTKIGYHLVGGAEFRMTGWMWLAGEVQWAAVPNAIGEGGVSALFEEDDLGGTTFRFKILFGR